ncbi:MAG: PEP-CTERM sorting domain-containing protein, partial [Planctomycetota bacterium]
FSDWGTNDNGLGGTQVQAWAAGPSRAGGGRNAVTNGSQGVAFGTTSVYEFDVTTVAPDGFQVAFDFSRFVTAPDPGPGGGGYIAFGLGVDIGSPLNDFTAIGASDWSVLFQQANNGNAANASAFEDNTSISNFDYLTPDVPHTLEITAIPAISGAYGETDTVNISVVVDGTITQNYSVLGGVDFGTFAVSANNFDTRFIDDLVVTAVPEPATAALLGLGALAMLRRRG